MAIDNKDKKVLKSSIEREQNELACSAEREKIKGSKNLNVPHLRFPEFSGEWNKYTINDLATVVGGGTPDTTVKSYWGGDIQWFTPSEIGKNKYVDFSKRTITRDGLDNSSAKLLPLHTILLSSRATVGECSIASNECTTNQGFQSLIAKQCNIDFLYYLIQTKKKDLIRNACGSTFLEISANEIRKIKVAVPVQNEQEQIAKLLSLIDERIATQNKIIDKLKSLIKGIDEVVFQSCSKHCKLKEFDNQITAGRDKVEEGCFPLYGSTGVIGTTATPSYHEPLVLVARVGSIGCVQFVNIPCGVSDNTIVIRCGSKAKYVYYYLQNYNFERITSGTTQPLITAKDVKHIDIPIIDSANDLKAINTLDTLNMKLELESNLYNTILKQKAFLLQQMFI
ncbi:restriction endonuclease subunit S [Bacteroides thetaiotaomicron]|uniref:restriction endonuclease subunit S n=1 Tax=Bacteroides thetaiotaomicron TaxID=818 RepID=UPI0018DE0FEC|nr:restriction endonuclease subunit S [Bacteroides thetaiotaomicron]MBI0305572.1 restriction endonuclease subunit S [Bacteroides thetaiotaomicron]MBM6520274.1 restriction endonuclease subunit S [Bacteroides thetaiotaomicron]MCS2628863.1 restriction endonuclease subunit S [Bacteroides thetaiotaomicron]MCS2826943.1 restriction endonuclease subunit S [Bacteroides thetaiotaomicron]UYU87994.1 restriction endonuclease subunit S [Bacteroides thetaiotaomicron]